MTEILLTKNNNLNKLNITATAAELGLIFKDVIYIDNKHKHTFECLTCRAIFKDNIIVIRKRKYKSCPFCNKTNTPKKRKYSLSQIKENYLKENILYLEDTFDKVSTCNLLKCLVCNYEWKASYNDFTNGYRCRSCANIKNSIRIKLSYQFVKEKFFEKNIAFLDEVYEGARYAHNVQCLKYLTVFKAIYNNFFRREQNCPNCFNESFEKTVEHCLRDIFSVDIIPQQKIEMPFCNFQKRCYVDFYFKFLNKKFIVEYNGDQHYKIVTFGGKSQKDAEKRFVRQQKRDEWLKSYCKSNDITLIEIDGRKINTRSKISNFIINLHNKLSTEV